MVDRLIERQVKGPGRVSSLGESISAECYLYAEEDMIEREDTTVFGTGFAYSQATERCISRIGRFRRAASRFAPQWAGH